MQQGRGGMGSHKHGISGHASQSPRLRLMKKLAAERGAFHSGSARRPNRLEFKSVQDAMRAEQKRR